MPFIENSILIVEKGMSGATGNVYTGLLEFEDMSFLLHVLRPGDLFADIGANVGVYTILAAKNAGANVVSFEPIPSTFHRLQRNVGANKVAGQVELKCYAVGEKAETLRFTESLGAVNHVVGVGETVGDQTVIEIPVRSIDELLNGSQPVLFKIDVEGFEWPALLGARQHLASSSLKGIIIELNGNGGRYGFADEQIHQLLRSFGFSSYSYDPFARIIRPLPTFGAANNTIYIKDAEWVTSRVQSARKFNILGEQL